MGKKGSWFSAIKKVFLPHPKEKLANESDRKSTKEKKKKGLGKLRHGDTNSFIPLFREPSSIEKILDEAEREHKLIFRPPTPPEQPRTPPFVPRAASPKVPSQRVTSPRAASPRVSSPRAASPKVASPRAPSPKNAHRHKEIYYRPEPTLKNHHASATKIQAAYRGYIARRSFRALKGLVRLQGVVRGQSVKRQTTNAMKYMQLLVRVQSQIQSRRIQMLENQARRQAQYRNDKEVESNNEDWDDSLLTKEEIEARLQRKVNAVIKRERAMAYAYSHQLWKSTPKSAQSALADIRSNGFPWWWNWLERQLPPSSTPDNQAIKHFQLTPSRLHSELKPSPRPSSSNNKQHHFAFDSMDTPTPRSSKSVAFMSTRQARTPGIGSFKWNKGSFFSGKDSGSQKGLDKHQPHSIGDLSVDSTVSMPATVGRKPFNRFV
ncbi:conserved hypothetical protein [Ricinus communis]|uniref:Calmodulin binding protein n=1 Tax=Ricinus communis TaxID=3988 RepID=B9T0X1_RICCO|nr:conserved hypothetical protein [Ricinus communis]